MRETKFFAAVTPVSRNVDSTDPVPTVAVRRLAIATGAVWLGDGRNQKYTPAASPARSASHSQARLVLFGWTGVTCGVKKGLPAGEAPPEAGTVGPPEGMDEDGCIHFRRTTLTHKQLYRDMVHRSPYSNEETAILGRKLVPRRK